ncbi:BC_2427 family protein [Lysinibacillus sp. NPDC093190]|uniref:BC_2427 family protein n=1 Tax=Lysinibacillus sp. NPDC093190 TaxID=3390575 RepID=UPI003D0451B1
MKTPWINYREMKEISSKQKVFININYQTKSRKKIDHASQKKSTFEILNSPHSDFVNNPLDIEKEDETNSLVEEQELATHLDSNHELLIPPEIDVEDVMNVLHDIEEAEEINPIAEQELIEHLGSDYELLIPPEIDVEDEMNELLDIEESDKTNPVEERELTEHLDSDHELLTSSEIDAEDEMNILFDIEEAEEINPIAEQELTEHLDSDYELLIPPEIDVEDEMNDLLDIEESDKTNPVEEREFVARLDSNCELFIPSEIDVEDEINDPLDIEEADKIIPVEEQDFISQLDSNREFLSPSESDKEDKIRSTIDTEEMEKTNPAGHDSASTKSVQGEIYSRTQKILISTHVEIADFLHAPICGEVVKNTFDFLDPDNHLSPQFKTKLFSTTTDYPEQPDCRLVHSKINEIIFLMKTDTYDKNNQKSSPSKSVVVPLHNTQSLKKGETNYHSYSFDDFMHIRAPVVVGEYKIEICLEENIVFEKGIVGVKDISNEVVLTNCSFAPTQFSQSLGNGTCSTLRGNLFIEGYIHQSIEYTASHIGNAVPAQNESLIHSNQMCQNIVLEIIIHLLQAQKIRVPKI